jgi:serine/threonine-protein kinase
VILSNLPGGPQPDQSLGSYRLISRLGAGGMGEVWRAEDTRLLRPVAIKILNEKIASDPEWKARFMREARTVAQMNHPNIATIYSIEQEGDMLFIAMELVEGESLASLLARGPLPPREVARQISQVAEALGEAHEKGIVHRDVKPDNIIVAKRTVKVLDFGIAKQTNKMAADSKTLTQGGMIVGTPYYMSPEQALGKQVDSRSDIFSLGVVMYEAITGRRPFDGESVTETMMNIIMNEPPDVAAVMPTAPRALADVVRRALQKKPDQRFQTATEMVDAMARINFDAPATPVPQKHYDATVSLSPVSAPTPATPAAPAPSAAPPQTKDPIAGQRALVADDDPIARYLIGSVLAQHRVAYDEAANGAEAVKALKVKDYTMLFLDLLMPRVDGWGVIDYLRRAKAAKMPRIFVITGVKDQSLSTADKDIVTGLLFKPLEPSQVDNAVQKTLRGAA